MCIGYIVRKDALRSTKYEGILSSELWRIRKKLSSLPIFYWFNYDYHFIIKESVKEFKKQLTCLGGKAEKYITFTVPIKKEVTRIDKNGEEVTKKYLTCYLLLTAQELWQVLY